MAKKRRRIRAVDIIAAMENWSTPVDIEEQVTINFFGTLVTNTPLELTDIELPDGRGILTPTWKEKRIICEKIDAFAETHTREKSKC